MVSFHELWGHKEIRRWKHVINKRNRLLASRTIANRGLYNKQNKGNGKW